MTDPTHDVTEDELHYCEVHPDEETSLRCNRCGRYMCVKCANRTPVGYTCNECFKGHEDKFYHATQNDYIVIAGVSVVLSAIAGGLFEVIFLPFIFAIIIGLPLGGLIGEVGLRAVQRRRGRQSHIIATASTVIGALLGATVAIYIRYNQLFRDAPAQFRDDFPFTEFLWNALSNNFTLWIFIILLAMGVYGMYKTGRKR